MSILCLCYQVLQWYSPIFIFLTHRVQLSHFDFAFCHICSQLRRNKELGGWGFSHPSHSRTFAFSQRFINAPQSAQIFGTIRSRWIHAAVCRFRALRFDLKSVMAPLIVLCTAFLLITECRVTAGGENQILGHRGCSLDRDQMNVSLWLLPGE